MTKPIPATAIPRVQAEWHWLGPLLAPAVAHDANRSLADVYRLLVEGRLEAAVLCLPETAVVVVSELCEIDGVRVCWLSYLVGKTRLGPKASIAMARETMKSFEALARKAGAEEIRIGGRDWSSVFPDFERFDPDHPNRMRKKL